MGQLSKAVRDALKARIVDADYGINARISDLAPSYTGLPLPSFDFSASSRQYIEAAISADALDAAGYTIFPRLLVYSSSNEHRNLRKSAVFSGDHVHILEYHVSFPTNVPPLRADEQSDLLEEATLLMLNDLSPGRQDWMTGVPSNVCLAWNGEFTQSRSTVVVGGGESWLQILRFLLRFEVDVLS